MARGSNTINASSPGGMSRQRAKLLKSLELPQNAVPGTPYTPEQLDRYCDNLIKATSLKPGDILALDITHPDQKPFAKAMITATDRADVMLDVLTPEDPDNLAGQIDQAVQHGTVMHIQSFSPERETFDKPSFSPAAWQSYNEALSENHLQWNVSVWPTREWAHDVYPELPSDQAFVKLGQDLASFARSGDQDEPDALENHLAMLRRRSDWINELAPSEIVFQGPGTDLRVPLMKGSRFLPVAWNTTGGKQMLANCPTEEIFTTPDYTRVQGTFTCSRPLIVGSDVVEGIGGRFEAGQLVEIWCDDEDFQEWLQEVFVGNPEMGRIGELGLVDPQSRIGKTGKTFFNNIIDENAGTHLGMGNSYAIGLTDEARSKGQVGNKAPGHFDFIIGHPGMDIQAVTADGLVDIVKNGAWQDPASNTQQEV